jgi:hypothetical protein
MVKRAGKFRFYTAAGWLTVYALACGYVQTRGPNGWGARITMEHGVFHVTHHAKGQPHRVIFRKSYPRIKDARCAFCQQPPETA